MHKRLLFIGVFITILLIATPSGAVLVNLTEEQAQEAIKYGKEKKDADYLEFFKEWRVDLGDGKGSARVITEFSKVAFEAKNLPFEYISPGKGDIEKIKEELRDRLAFGVALYGDTIDFAKDCHAVLRYKNNTLRPIEERHAETAETTQSWPKSPAYKAICYYYFDLHHVDPNAKVVLEVSLPGRKKVEFPFDLSKMR